MNRYERFCRSVKSMGRIKEPNLGLEVHHILPRSMGGDNDPSNLVVMTIREHFLAHIMLWLAHDRGTRQAQMVLMMFPDVRLPTNCTLESLLTIKSRTVEMYRQQIYDSLKDVVYVTPVGSSERISISSEEYKENKSEYQHHNAGKVTVYDLQLQKYVAITTEEYYEDDNYRYEWVPKSTGKHKYIHPTTLDTISCLENDKPDGYVHWNSYHQSGRNNEWMIGKVPVFYIKEQISGSMTREEFEKRNNVDVVHACRKKKFLTEVI